MIRFTAIIKKFGEQGEKTGWTYIIIPAEEATKLKPGNKKSFRVKGKLDNHPVKQMALLPMGGDDFILPLKAEVRKKIGKRMGHSLQVQIEKDDSPILPSKELMTCLKDEPEALAYFRTLAKSHQNYFTKWIEAAKTDETKAKRIARTLNAFNRKQTYSEMIRALQRDRKDLSERS